MRLSGSQLPRIGASETPPSSAALAGQATIAGTTAISPVRTAIDVRLTQALRAVRTIPFAPVLVTDTATVGHAFQRPFGPHGRDEWRTEWRNYRHIRGGDLIRSRELKVLPSPQ